MTTWSCSVCAQSGDGVATRCKSCNSIVCTPCAKSGVCVNCDIEQGERWFAPAAEEPLGSLPRRLPLALLALVLFGPLLIMAVATLMGRVQAPAPPRPAVHFKAN